MTKAALGALRDANFEWIRSLESIWSDEDAGGGGPNEELADEIVASLLSDTKSAGAKPPARLLVGEAGVGKTHLVGDLRRRAWAAGAWFVLLDVIGITDFWKSAALSFLTSLLQEMPGGRRQYEVVLSGVARTLNVEAQVEAAFAIPDIDARRIVDLLVPGLMRLDPAKALKHQDVFRALLLLRSHDYAAVGLAHAWLQGYDADEEARRALGFTSPPPPAVDLVRGMSWIMGLAGPTLIAVDQIDGVIGSGSISVGGDEFGEKRSFADLLAAGLLQLYDVASRSQTIVTCLYDSWKAMEGGLSSAVARIRMPPTLLKAMNDADSVAGLIAGRLTPAYTAHGFFPDYPTWPFAPAAFADVLNKMPRAILIQCDAVRRLMLTKGEIEVVGSLEVQGNGKASVIEPSKGFDAELQHARAAAKVDVLIDKKDDTAIGRLLRDTFDLFAHQFEPNATYDVESRSDPAQRMPPLHGRLTFTFHDEADRERHFCYRAIEHENATAFSARLRAAMTASGISNQIPDRHLLIVRRGATSSGPKTKALVEGFRKAGGLVLDPTDDDLQTFAALCAVRDRASAGRTLAAFEAWLRDSEPLSQTAFFKAAGLSPPPGFESGKYAGDSVSKGETPRGGGGKTAKTPPSSEGHEKTAGKEPPRPSAPTSIPIGRRLSADAEPVLIPMAVLPRHTAIIAGAGSGKTVLLRRLVEEAALAGIPAIVIDPNNDLSRLGDAWPDRPALFDDADAAKAVAYEAKVEVVVWTPGIHAGNPLFLSVLPDFAAVGDDPDERGQAVTMAAETLGPLAGAKTNLQKGVLADALRYFAASRGDGTFKDMTALLADLPDGVSDIGNAEKHAAKMADELKAAVATNPLLKATGAIVDPALLFRARQPGKTRISVINLSGLASEEAKEDFVNRLQMTLFGWIKKHPSPQGMLYVIDEAQTFVPSGRAALSRTSGVQLVAQARKYGLGMIVVTQAPKGIDNKVISNCTTQFLGKQNAPTDQASVKEMVAATGGKADDIGKLSVGEFYFKSESTGKPYKVKTPTCLSWHPPNPPTPEEVVARAKRTAG